MSIKASWTCKQLSQGWYDWNSIHRKEIFNNLCGGRVCVDRKTLSDTEEEFSFTRGKWYRNLWKQIRWGHSMLSHGGIVLCFPVESGSVWIDTRPEHFPLPLSWPPHPPGDSPSGDWLQAHLLIGSDWLVQTNPSTFLNGIHCETEDAKVRFQKHCSLGRVPAHLRPVHEISSPLKQNLGSQASLVR